MAHKDDVGRSGEEIAARWLEGKGAQVLARNWRCEHGEIDIIAREGGALVVVEVKTRTSVAFGHPAEAVTWAKRSRLRRLAGAWLAAHEGDYAEVRIDVVAVLARQGRPTLIEHLIGVG